MVIGLSEWLMKLILENNNSFSSFAIKFLTDIPRLNLLLKILIQNVAIDSDIEIIEITIASMIKHLKFLLNYTKKERSS